MSTQAEPRALIEHDQIRTGHVLVSETEDWLPPIGEDRQIPKPVQTAVFDQDESVLDMESLTATSWSEVGPRYGTRVDDNFPRRIQGCKPDEVKQVCTQQFGKDAMRDYDRFREEKRQCSYRWIAQHGVPVRGGLKELLIYLKGRNIKATVAMASGESWAQGNVRGAGVEDYFNGHIHGDMVKGTKLDPTIFLPAARRLRMEPEVCVILGDSFNGIRAATASGSNPVMIPDQDQPDEEIHKLLTTCCGSLTGVIGFFETGRFSLRQPQQSYERDCHLIKE